MRFDLLEFLGWDCMAAPMYQTLWMHGHMISRINKRNAGAGRSSKSPTTADILGRRHR